MSHAPIRHDIFVWVLMAWMGTIATAAAQSSQSGDIFGRVTDSQGLPVPNVEITITSPTLQRPRSTVTGADGQYAFLRLPPGPCGMTFEADRFRTARYAVTVILGLAIEQDVTLVVGGRTDDVLVVAAAPSPILSGSAGVNYAQDEIDLLATPRTLEGIAQLAPGVSENTPNAGQVAINGGFAFDNVFMVNGVDVGDNLFASPFNLFIEDAIAQTQILTAGVPIDYGRFTGGVVNAVTKSGGNAYSGSWRTNASNPSWESMTPLERCVAPGRITHASCRPADARPDDLQFVHEATLGGPIVKDMLWFFGAMRLARLTTAGSLPRTNFQNVQLDLNRRGEAKLTGTLRSRHSIQVGYMNNATTQRQRPTLPFSIDRFALGDRTLPNWYAFGAYRVIVGESILAETQVSHRIFRFNDSGARATGIVDSPFVTRTRSRGHYNGPYFDPGDPESRNATQLAGSLTYFRHGKTFQRQEVRVGYEFARNRRVGGNSQSATGYVFDADYATDNGGAPVYDDEGRLIPLFQPGLTLIEHWLPVRGAALDVHNSTLFGQNRFSLGENWSADVGIRYERTRTRTTDTGLGVGASRLLPRLGAGYDIAGQGEHILHATYSWYSGRYSDLQMGATSNVGNPDLLLGVYVGPPGRGRNFAAGFDPRNYLTVFGQFPGRNVFFARDLSSPVAKEFTASVRSQLFARRALVEASFVHRNLRNIVEDTISVANGVTAIAHEGLSARTFTNVVYRNMEGAWRDYRGLQFQGRFNVRPRLTVDGHYTLQLKNDGNYEGEGPNSPGATTRLGDYAEAFTANRHYPGGRLDDYQRHKIRLWAIYGVNVRRFGDASLSVLWRIDSGTTFSYVAGGQSITETQAAKLSAAGYPDRPLQQDVYFGRRGEGRFRGFQVVDVAATYRLPAISRLRPYLNVSVFNVLNNQKLIRWDVTVEQNAGSTLDENGLATGYSKTETFGLAISNAHFPTPSIGGTGGRTWRLAAGFRF